MPIIQHGAVPMPPAADCYRERAFVSGDNGAESLTIKEVELLPGWEGRLHTHPTDLAIMVTEGAVQVVMGDQLATVRASFEAYQKELNRNGYDPVTTESGGGKTFYYAEDYHQQYLAKNPWGYCGIGGTGVSYCTPAQAQPVTG